MNDRALPIEKEYNVTQGLPGKVTGTFDALIGDIKHKVKILADIKTANSNQFKKYSNYLPKVDHIKQLSSYGYGYLNLHHSYDLLLMMYFSSGSDHPQFYFVEPYKDIDIEMNKYIKAVNDYEKTKILPPRLDDVLDKDMKWQCSYCDFINISCDGLIKGGLNE